MDRVRIYTVFLFLQSIGFCITSVDILGALSASLDSTICLWDLENNGALVTSFNPGALQAWKAKFSPDGKYFASGSHSGDLNVYSIENGDKVASYSSKNNFAMCVAYVSI